MFICVLWIKRGFINEKMLKLVNQTQKGYIYSWKISVLLDLQMSEDKLYFFN